MVRAVQTTQDEYRSRRYRRYGPYAIPQPYHTPYIHTIPYDALSPMVRRPSISMQDCILLAGQCTSITSTHDPGTPRAHRADQVVPSFHPSDRPSSRGRAAAVFARGPAGAPRPSVRAKGPRVMSAGPARSSSSARQQRPASRSSSARAEAWRRLVPGPARPGQDERRPCTPVYVVTP